MASVINGRSSLMTGLRFISLLAVLFPVSVVLSTETTIYTSPKDIADAQTILCEAGYLTTDTYRRGEVDSPTAAAIQEFQSSHQLQTTGALDYETMTQILSHGRTLGGNGGKRTAWIPERDEASERHAIPERHETLVLHSVRFDTGTARLKPSARATLDDVADSLKARPDARIQVSGHTDSRNTESYNLHLSEERAEAVRNYLVDKGVEESRLRDKGYGESHPIADNSTAAGRAANRRVELTRID